MFVIYIFGEMANLNISTCFHLYNLNIVGYMSFKVTKVIYIVIEEIDSWIHGSANNRFPQLQ